jgi:hypothetical protein
MLERLTMNQSTLKKAFFIILFLSLVPFLILTAFSNPAYDDYCYASNTLEYGFFHSQIINIHYWSGRYFSTALLSLNPITFGNFIGYKIISLVIIILTLSSIFCFVSAIFDSRFAFIDKLITAVLLTALFSNHMPDVTEGYYWMPGSVSYQLGSALTLFFFAAVIKSLKSPQRIKIAWLTLCATLIFMIVGSSETSMIFLLFLLSSVTIKAFSIKDQNRHVWLVLLLVAILCSAVVLAAPGNVVRSSYMPNRHRLFFSLGMALAQGLRYLLKWVFDPAFGLSTILFIPIANQLSNKSALLKSRLYLHPISSMALLLVLVFLGFFPPLWATGMFVQERTVNTAYFFFLPGWFITIAIGTCYLQEKRDLKIPSLPTPFYLVGLPLVALCLVFTNNTKDAFADLLTNRAYEYDRRLSTRRLQFEQCAREEISDCSVQKLEDLPVTTSNPYFETALGCDGPYWRLRTRASKDF